MKERPQVVPNNLMVPCTLIYIIPLNFPNLIQKGMVRIIILVVGGREEFWHRAV